jgi:hypothetical protein
MKSLFSIIAFLFFTNKLLAQSSEINNNYFKLPASEAFTCPNGTINKLFYNLPTNTASYCGGIYYFPIDANWVREGNSIYYNAGKVGIGIPTTPLYELEFFSPSTNMNVRNNLQVDGNIGINTINPSEKVELYNRRITFGRTIDITLWHALYEDGFDGFSFKEANNPPTLLLKNGGNVGLGTTSPSTKLSVNGTGSYDGNITVEGLGMIQSSTANQLIMYQSSFTTPTTFTIAAGTCQSTPVPITIPTGTFSVAPAIFIGNQISGILGNGVTINVESVTATSANIRFCNINSSAASVNNSIFKYTAVGQ